MAAEAGGANRSGGGVRRWKRGQRGVPTNQRLQGEYENTIKRNNHKMIDAITVLPLRLRYSWTLRVSTPWNKRWSTGSYWPLDCQK